VDSTWEKIRGGKDLPMSQSRGKAEASVLIGQAPRLPEPDKSS